jgi:two-component system KDP operon response regulator KdpE
MSISPGDSRGQADLSSAVGASRSTKAAILVVDDDVRELGLLRASLLAQGYEVRTAAIGDDALGQILQAAPDLILLNLAEPVSSGLDLCLRIREVTLAPIIALSGVGAETDGVEALDRGADDFLTKPFNMNELLARVRATLRRSAAPADDHQVLTAGELSIDTATRRVTISGTDLRLTPKEFEILAYLASNKGKVVTHRELLEAVWGPQASEETGYLRVFINRLRRKIEPDPTRPTYILTVHWVGYRLSPSQS